MILDVVTDTKKEFKYPRGTNMELDVWIPEHNIAFEFQVFLFIYFVYLYLSSTFPLPTAQINQDYRMNITIQILGTPTTR